MIDKRCRNWQAENGNWAPPKEELEGEPQKEAAQIKEQLTPTALLLASKSTSGGRDLDIRRGFIRLRGYNNRGVA
ncbi:hypothetical protein NDU88_002597 [Pleurodeles waltl]|uniref:Uncharacterized protein n=1 Tax=Pleurodeles waltl TaxID=8319 RepID=A0AAV7LCU5_PLEWA|nr:hypothetical protein NDU88_002597 [Pleurodeles waltl]